MPCAHPCIWYPALQGHLRLHPWPVRKVANGYLQLATRRVSACWHVGPNAGKQPVKCVHTATRGGDQPRITDMRSLHTGEQSSTQRIQLTKSCSASAGACSRPVPSACRTTVGDMGADAWRRRLDTGIAQPAWLSTLPYYHGQGFEALQVVLPTPALTRHGAHRLPLRPPLSVLPLLPSPTSVKHDGTRSPRPKREAPTPVTPA